jgi:hypothetical protein
MSDSHDFKTYDRIGNVLGLVLSVGCYALVFWPLLRTVLE